MGARVSVCLIVQNAARSLRLCLESARPVADELVIVDGGSHDGTASLARAYATSYVRQPFHGNFAEQRNTYLELARGDWILALDADECLGSGASSAISRLLAQPSASCFWFPRFWLVPGWPPRYVSEPPLHPDPQYRLFRRQPGVAYLGSIHERLVGTEPAAPAPRVKLFHFDFILRTHRSRQAKVRRYHKVTPGAGYPQYYLYERYGYRLSRLPLTWLPAPARYPGLFQGEHHARLDGTAPSGVFQK